MNLQIPQIENANPSQSYTFVLNPSSVLRINICGKNRHLRQALNDIAKRLSPFQLEKLTLEQIEVIDDERFSQLKGYYDNRI